MTRLHSQYDFGKTSRDAKIDGREAIRIHPRDAEARGIADGDIVRVFNDRGATLAGAVVTDRVRPGVVVLPTGAWYDPADPPGRQSGRAWQSERAHAGRGHVHAAQGTSAHSCLVEVERYDGPLPDEGVPPAADDDEADQP